MLIALLCYGINPAFSLDGIDDFEATIEPKESVYWLTITTHQDLHGEQKVAFNDSTYVAQFEQGVATFSLGNFKELALIKVYVQGAYHQKFYRFDEADAVIEPVNIPLWLTILPPLIAILLALIFKEVIVSLFTGIWLGAFIAHGLSFKLMAKSFVVVVDTYLVNALVDSGHISVIVFSLLIGGMVAIISRNGGMAGIVKEISDMANNARNSQLVTWVLGVGIFFDDYANTLIVGNTMRPVTDKYHVSREKLAYIVDSTAAPMAAIAFISTWIGTELGYIADASKTLKIGEGAYSIFFHSLAYSFYPILTLAFMLILILLKKDFGPMWKAENRARTTGEVSKPTKSKGAPDHTANIKNLEPVDEKKLLWFNAFIPVVVVLLVTLIGLWVTGTSAVEFNWRLGFWGNVSKVIGASDSYVALLWASLSGVLVAVLLTQVFRIMPITSTMESMLEGIKTMLPAIIILVLAWSLAGVTDDLHTAAFLASVVEGNISPMMLPFITFLLAAMIAFSTGSSWGTMAILYPLVLPITWNLIGDMPPADAMPIYYNVVSVVLAGSVLGDHCSPISDTTILSSLASGCNHIDHVRTQLPYAIIVGVVSVVVGGLFALIGLHWTLNFLVGIGLIFGVIWFFGKKVPETK